MKRLKHSAAAATPSEQAIIAAKCCQDLNSVLQVALQKAKELCVMPTKVRFFRWVSVRDTAKIRDMQLVGIANCHE